MNRPLKIMAISFFVALVVTVLAYFFYTSFNNITCRERAEMMRMNHYYSLATDCMVEVDGGWVPLSAIRYDFRY